MTIEKREVLANHQVRLTIRVDPAVWQRALADCYQAAKDKYPIDGEATRAALEKKYGPTFLFNEAVNTVYPQALIDAVEEAGLLAAGSPALEVCEISGEAFSFRATITLYPPCKLGQYKDLSAPFTVANPTADEIAKATQDFLSENKIAAHPDKAAKGDEVNIDFEGFTDGKPFEGGKAAGYALVLGGGMFIDGFEDQLVGISVGEERDVNVTFPKQYAPALAGKKARFHCKCNAITRYTIPRMSEDFARSLGHASQQDLQEQILLGLREVKQAEATDAFAEALIKQIIDTMEVAIPDAMVDNQLDNLVQSMSQQLANQGMTLEQYLEASHLDEKALRDHFRPQAKASIHFDIAMTEIAKLEKLTVSEEELNEQYRSMAGVYGMSEEALRTQLPVSRLRHDLLLGKAREFVVANGRRI